MKWQAALLVLFCLAHYPCPAQALEESSFTHYTVSNGLSDNQVTGLAQDSWGFIWISTANGLNRFDGREFRPLHQSPGRPGLLSDEIIDVASTGKKLLLYSMHGAQWIDLSSDRFTNLVVPGSPFLAPYLNDVQQLAWTDDGTCFESAFTGAYAFDSTGKLRFRYDHWKSLPAQTVGTRYGSEVLKLDGHRLLHIDNRNKLSIYDSRRNSFLPIEAYRYSLPGLYSLNGRELKIHFRLSATRVLFYFLPERLLAVYDTQKDEVQWRPPAPEWLKYKIDWQSRWLGLSDTTAIIYRSVAGLCFVHFNPETLTFSFRQGDLFANQLCTAALLDREGRLWIGTRNGLYVQNTRVPGLQSLSIPYVNNSPFKVPVAYNSFLRRGNLLYVGTYHFLPVAVLDAGTYAFKRFLSFEKLSPRSNQIWNMLPFSKDTIWFGTQDGLVWYNEKNGSYGRVKIPAMDSLLQGHPISLLFRDSEGGLWIQGKWGSGLLHFDPATGAMRRFANEDKKNFLPLRVVNFAAEDADHNLWFAENGLVRWNRQKDVFDTLVQSYAGFNGGNPKIFALCSDGNGRLVFANQNNGVLVFDPRSRTYEQVSTAQGLPENAVLAVLSLPGDQLWIVSRNYITAINRRSGKSVSYSYADSLPQSGFNYAMHDPAGGRLLFGYDDKVVWTNDRPDSISRPRFPFFIDALHVAEDTSILFPSGTITLGYRQDDITLHFSSLDFNDPPAGRFGYRINNGPWQSLGSENTLRFSSLAPGTYNLEIRNYPASDSELESIRRLQIVIRPPFWQTTLFYLLAACLLLAAGYAFYRGRIRQVKRRAAAEKQFAELEIKALHAQMNPHFVFNCLNGIREMILNGENQQASHYLSKFAHLMRLTLSQSSKPFISLKDTVDYLHRYLEMEQVRSAHFGYTIEVEDMETRTIYLPPMLIQPFIENAVWHGTAAVHRPLRICIRFFQRGEYLFCVVEDDGIGIDASLRRKQDAAQPHQSVGIGNVRQRIQVLNEKYNLHSSLSIEDKSRLAAPGETGTVVTIQLLIKNTRS